MDSHKLRRGPKEADEVPPVPAPSAKARLWVAAMAQAQMQSRGGRDHKSSHAHPLLQEATAGACTIGHTHALLVCAACALASPSMKAVTGL